MRPDQVKERLKKTVKRRGKGLSMPEHQELLLTDLKHGLSFNPLHPVFREPGVFRATSATPRGHIHTTYRNFWVPGTRWQFTGIRLAREETS
jgi:hypothetical protein